MLPAFVLARYRVAQIFSATGLLLSGSAILGWAIDMPSLRSLIPGMPQMIPMTGVALFCLSWGMLFCSTAITKRFEKIQISHVLCFSFAFAACALSFVTLIGHLFGVETGLNHLFFARQFFLSGIPTIARGNMSVQTSSVILCLSVLILLRPLRSGQKNEVFFQIVPFLILTLGLLAITSYMHDFALDGPVKWIGMSLPTSFVTILISLSLLAVEPNLGFMARYRSHLADGDFLRRYSFLAVLLPILATTIILLGEHKQYYPPAFSSSLFVIVTIVGLFILGVFIADALGRSEARRIAIEQRQARAALRESEESLLETKERLEIALEASRMGAWEADLISKVSSWSETASQIIGSGSLRKNESSYFAELVHPDDRSRYLLARENAISENGLLDLDFRIVRSDASVRWVRCKAKVRYAEDGKPLKFNGTILDITDEKSDRQRLEAALREAESANELKTTFLTNMSHEIRTPLGAILGFTDLLGDPHLSSDERASYLEIISRNGKTLSHLLNDILDLSKVESGHLNVETVTFSLKNLIDEVISLLQLRAAEKNIELVVRYDDLIPETVGSDPMRLKQILINLVGNAIKFTPYGKVDLFISAPDNKVCFQITDTGIGVGPEQKERLFRPFSQADDSTSRKYGGTGLGLTLSRRLAELLGGSVELKESKKGVGSVFVATVTNEISPLGVSADLSPLRFNRLNSSHSLSDLKILIAEDVLDNQKLLGHLLRPLGAQVEIANDGEECVKIALAKKFDIILMDIQMPRLDGYGATKRLREGGYNGAIIALTAHAMSDVLSKCLKAGCDSQLTKPIDRDRLVETVLRYARPESVSSEIGT